MLVFGVIKVAAFLESNILLFVSRHTDESQNPAS